MKLNFVGDIMLGRGIGETLKEKGNHFVFKGIALHIPKANGLIANLEAPFAREGNTFVGKDPHLTFKIEPELVSALKHIHVTSVTLANNHIADFGYPALESTTDTLKRNEISYTGAGQNLAEATEPIAYIDEETHQSVAIFSFNAFVPFTTTAKSNKFGVARFDKKTVHSTLKRFRSKYNAFIITVHWGVDYHQFPIPQFVRFAKQLIDVFPEIIAIIGHHPHLQQPVTYHKGRPIFFSLGNFIFDEPFPLSRIGSILTLEIENMRVINYSILFTKLDNEFKLIPLPEDEVKIENDRLKMIKLSIDKTTNEYKKMDKKWIRYLIYQTLRYRSFNDLSYLLTHYSPIQIIKSIVSK